jgi:predicted nucleotidyltransferase
MVALSGILELSERLVRTCQPERVILFGSHAYGTPGEYSDVDLLVIMPFEGDAFDKSIELLGRLKPSFAVDLLVRRPDDTSRRYAEFDPLIREALDRGRVLYERDR